MIRLARAAWVLLAVLLLTGCAATQVDDAPVATTTTAPAINLMPPALDYPRGYFFTQDLSGGMTQGVLVQLAPAKPAGQLGIQTYACHPDLQHDVLIPFRMMLSNASSDAGFVHYDLVSGTLDPDLFSETIVDGQNPTCNLQFGGDPATTPFSPIVSGQMLPPQFQLRVFGYIGVKNAVTADGRVDMAKLSKYFLMLSTLDRLVLGADFIGAPVAQGRVGNYFTPAYYAPLADVSCPRPAVDDHHDLICV